MDLNNLYPNQRYLFHYKKSKNNENDATFRANFIKASTNGEITTIIVNCYVSKNYPNDPKTTRRSIDADLLSKIESLPDIIGNGCVLPDDVLLEIDDYL